MFNFNFTERMKSQMDIMNKLLLASGTLMLPDVNAPLEEGDVVWVVGEKEDVYQLVDQKNEKVQAG